MYIEQLYTKCLAEAAYYIESNGEAAIIDPLRETAPYLELAKSRKSTIKYVFETHFHADFVSGHIDLAAKSGAQIVYGPGARAGYEIYTAGDGELFKVGEITIKVLHTPGHTLESSCFLLLDENGVPHSIFTGDTLFVGDVGRPDLAVKQDLSREQLAGMLYDSLESKIKTLPSYVVVYPGHGAGSACGKAIGGESHSTIGVQKETNYALKASSRDEFIKLVTDGLTEPPKYFFMDAAINRNGYRSIDSVMGDNTNPLTVDQFEKKVGRSDVLIIDTRDANVFGSGYIRGSINIGLKGSFAVTVGTLVDPDKELLLVCDEGLEQETILRLARVGYEKVGGYLEGGFKAWINEGKPLDKITGVSAVKFSEEFRYNESNLLDVRNPDEWIPGIVAGAHLIPLSKLMDDPIPCDSNKTCYIYCASGYRSMVAASILKHRGFKNVVNVEGGMKMIKTTGVAIKQLTTTPAN